nr:RidA family protein [Nocardiopsis sp. TSRI0078]
MTCSDRTSPPGTGNTRPLYCSGQTAVSGGGEPQHAGDMAAQSALSPENLKAVLGEAGTSLANLVRLNVCVTGFPEQGQEQPLCGAELVELLPRPS